MLENNTDQEVLIKYQRSMFLEWFNSNEPHTNTG